MLSKYDQYIFGILAALLLIIMPLLSSQYGQSGDEWLHIIYGQDIWNYFFNGNTQALDYSAKGLQYTHVELYGGFFEFITEVLHRWFPSIPILHLRHFFNAMFGAIIIIFCGLLAKKISQRWIIGIVALLMAIFSPKLFGESMNNPKDIPYAAGFIMSIYFVYSFWKDLPKKYLANLIGMGISFGLTLAVRPAGGILILAYYGLFSLIYYWTNRKKLPEIFATQSISIKKIILIGLACFIGGWIIGIMFWPYGIEHPISAPFESLKLMSNFQVQIKTLFEGEMMFSQNPKWYYEFKWISITSPIIVILSAIAFIVFIKKGIEKYGFFEVFVVLFSFLFPLLYMIYKNSTVYDTWRHVLFVYPFIVIAAALFLDILFSNYIKKEALILPLTLLTLLPEIVWSFSNHPNQYVYFNQFVGGIKGAYGYYETDYYQNSALQAAKWIRKNLRAKHQHEKIKILSNMGGWDQYFGEDTTWIKAEYGRWRERDHLNWDYYIAYSRFVSPYMLQHNKWPPANVVHAVTAGGVPLCVVIERKNKDDIAAFDSLNAGNYASAAQLYAQHLTSDKSNENTWYYYAISLANTGKINEAIQAIQNAIDIDSESNPEWFQILSKLYTQIGDQQNAQLNLNKAYDLANKLNENSGN